MIVYNTTYTMPNADARDFVIWVTQSMLPRVEANGLLSQPRLLRILSHHDQETECMSLQFHVESTALLHRWYTEIGEALNRELLKMFDQRIVGFSTIMEEIGS
ncbi:MAG: DUF4286 family protein [Bacteroidaceae bacterium]|nr:DUF4286 family protein [Bacteroidaceae bacterium]